MDEQLEAAIRNLNPDLILPIQNPPPLNAHNPIPPGLGPILNHPREPFYTPIYQQYRARLINEDESEVSSYGAPSSGEEWSPSSLPISGSSEDDDVVWRAFNATVIEHDPSEHYEPISAVLLEPYIPISYQDAISCPDSSSWIPAIHEEYNSIMENETWVIVPLPNGRRAIKCKWVLDFKEGYEGVDPRWKARLVACGYDQLYGVDYLATYSPVVKHHSIRLVLAIVAAFDLEMVQLDIKTAFLYGELKETIYMRQPEGYVIPGREEEVCRLQRPIYGLKQSSNCWNNEFNKFLLQFGFLRSKYDPCVYYRIRARLLE